MNRSQPRRLRNGLIAFHMTWIPLKPCSKPGVFYAVFMCQQHLGKGHKWGSSCIPREKKLFPSTTSAVLAEKASISVRPLDDSTLSRLNLFRILPHRRPLQRRSSTVIQGISEIHTGDSSSTLRKGLINDGSRERMKQ